MQKTENIIKLHGFDYCKWHGCFDIAARNEYLILIKVLNNIDSIQLQQSKNLKILSNLLEAFACIIGEHTRYEKLRNNIIYERFGIPAMTPETFECVISGNSPDIYRDRGGFFCVIDPENLRKSRLESGLTQEKLAVKARITKKAVYEHEHKRMRGFLDIVENIEREIDAKIRIPFEFYVIKSDVTNSACNSFEREIATAFRRFGFDISFVHQTPFNIIAREKKIILSRAENDEKKVKSIASHLAEFSEISGYNAIVITQKKCEIEIPSIDISSLSRMSKREFRSILS